LKQKYKYILMGLTLTSSSASSVEDLSPKLVEQLLALRREYGVSQRIHREVCEDLKLPLAIFSDPLDVDDKMEQDAARAAALSDTGAKPRGGGGILQHLSRDKNNHQQLLQKESNKGSTTGSGKSAVALSKPAT
jgi:hypothetical protein